MKLLRIFAEGSVVLLDEKPGDLILSKIVIGASGTCLVGRRNNASGSCGSRTSRELVGMGDVAVCRHGCARL